jgi:CHAT domain-containing protein
LRLVPKELKAIELVSKKCNVAFTDLTAGSGQTHSDTQSSTLTSIQNAHWLHLACHGEQDLKAPLNSKLLLRDGHLQLHHILAMKKPRPHSFTTTNDAQQFVFLSACQTAMGDADLENEALHIAGAFIVAGYRGGGGDLVEH